MTGFEGKSVIITGGAGGLGRAIAEGFCRKGATAVLADIDGDKAKAVAADLEASGGKALAIQADVSNGADVDRLFDAVLGAAGTLGVLVNNVAITHPDDVLTLPEERWDRAFDVNLKSYFLCSQRAARYWSQEGLPGRIVNIGSIDAELPLPERLTYCVSKAAVVALTRNLALSLAPHRINVTCVNPGLVAAGMLERAMADEARHREMLGWQPAGRFARPEEIADAVLYLASDAAGFITGATLTIDGGRLLEHIR